MTNFSLQYKCKCRAKRIMNKEKRNTDQDRHRAFFEQVSQENQLSMRILQLNQYLEILKVDLIPTSLLEFVDAKSLVETVSTLVYKIKKYQGELVVRDQTVESLRNKHRERQLRLQRAVEQKSTLCIQTDKRLARCQFQLQKYKQLLKNKKTQKNRKQATPLKQKDLPFDQRDLQSRHRQLVEDVEQLCEWMRAQNQGEEGAVRLKSSLLAGRQSKLKQVSKNTQKCGQELQEIIKKYNKT